MENQGNIRNCPTCTFICTDDTRASCEMCAAPLPAKRRVEIDLTNDEDEASPPHKAPRRALESAPPPRAGGGAAGSDKECPICMDTLGTEGGVQALGCMCCFCRKCIATSVGRQRDIGEAVTCPICRYDIPEAEQRAFLGDARQLEDSDDEDGEEGGEDDEEDDEDDEDDDEERESSDDEDRPRNGGWIADEATGRWVPGPHVWWDEPPDELPEF